MTDYLDQLDETTPSDSDLVSAGNEAMQLTRLLVKNWAGVEHYLTGEHKFVTGAPASRPAAGKLGRIFIDTTNGRIEYDDGTAWRMLHTVNADVGYTSAGLTLTTSWQDAQSLSVDVAVGGKILLLGAFDLNNTHASNQVLVNARLRVGSTTLHNARAFYADPERLVSCVLFGLSGTLSVGTHACTLQVSGTAGYAVLYRTLVAVTL